MTVDPNLQSILEQGREAHVAVVSGRGPHVTPELYAWSGDRLWFLFARSTLKAKVLARNPSAAVLVTAGGRSAMVEGEVDLVDLRRPSTLLGRPDRSARAIRATGSYVIRNAADLTAFGRDLATGQLGWRPPPLRVLASLEPRRAVLLDDGVIVSSDASPGLADGPQNVHAHSQPGGQRVAAAFPGPVVVPARWFPEDQELVVSPALLELHGIEGRTPVAVVADDYVAPGPAAKVGTLLRGTARRVGRTGSLAVYARTSTRWDGIDIETRRVGV